MITVKYRVICSALIINLLCLSACGGVKNLAPLLREKGIMVQAAYEEPEYGATVVVESLTQNQLPQVLIPNLKTLVIVGGTVSNFAALAKLDLQWLGIKQIPFKSLSFVKDMQSLSVLDVESCSISNISEISRLNLKRLSLASKHITDLSPIKNMKLEHLSVSCTSISNLNVITNMPLRYLDISYTQVSDISPIKDMPLEYLDISNTKVSDISAVKGMPLKKLYIGNSAVTNISVLSGTPLMLLQLEPEKITGGLDVLKKMPTLKFIAVGPSGDNPAWFGSVDKFQRIYSHGVNWQDPYVDKSESVGGRR